MTDNELEAMKREAKAREKIMNVNASLANGDILANHVLTLAAEVERLRDAIGIGVTICGNARRAVSSGQFHDKEVGRKIEEIERGLFTALQESPA